MLAEYCYIGNPKLGNSGDEKVRLWDLNTGKQVQSFKGPDYPEFIPDGKSLVTRDQDSVRFWDAMTGKEFAVAHASPSSLTVGPMAWSLSAVSIQNSMVVVPTSHHLEPKSFVPMVRHVPRNKITGQRKDAMTNRILDTRSAEKKSRDHAAEDSRCLYSSRRKSVGLTSSENNDSPHRNLGHPAAKTAPVVLGLFGDSERGYVNYNLQMVEVALGSSSACYSRC